MENANYKLIQTYINDKSMIVDLLIHFEEIIRTRFKENMRLSDNIMITTDIAGLTINVVLDLSSLLLIEDLNIKLNLFTIDFEKEVIYLYKDIIEGNEVGRLLGIFNEFIDLAFEEVQDLRDKTSGYKKYLLFFKQRTYRRELEMLSNLLETLIKVDTTHIGTNFKNNFIITLETINTKDIYYNLGTSFDIVRL